MVEVNLSLGWNYRDYLLILCIPTILICSIRQLKYIAPLTIVANILQIGGIALVFYQIFSSPLRDVGSVPLFGQASSLPVCFGIIFFAFGGISVVLPIQNQMTNPKVGHFKHVSNCYLPSIFSFQKMLGFLGTLNISITSCGILALVMGIFGYLKFGSDIKTSITLNLPIEDPLTQCCQVMLALAVFLSYALQYYVVMEIAGPNLIEPFISRSLYLFTEYLFRAILNVLISK
jgi:proton-coupled amino acid transporter